jgi:hypothetical protein
MESNRWLVVAFLAGGLLIGAAAYSVGLSQGATRAAISAGTNVDTLEAHWGWGHAHGWWGFPFGPIIAIFFWLWILRAVFWGFRGPWGWRRRWRYYHYDDDPRWFDDWHRQAHDRMREPGHKEV